MGIAKEHGWQLTFSFSKRVSRCSKDKSLLARRELAKFAFSILVENWEHIIFPNLSVLFAYAPIHNGWLFEKFVFQAEAFSYSFRMDVSLSKQLRPPEKMVVSLPNFNVLTFWCPVCTLLITCHCHWNRWKAWLQ